MDSGRLIVAVDSGRWTFQQVDRCLSVLILAFFGTSAPLVLVTGIAAISLRDISACRFFLPPPPPRLPPPSPSRVPPSLR